MTATITTRVTGAKAIAEGLQRRQDKTMSAVERAVKSEALGLVAFIKTQKLSDQVLKVRSGALRRSITARFDKQGDETRAYVGTNLKYARSHEYGFNGTVTVKAHQRMMKTAWGKPVKNPRQIDVRAHAMKMNLKPRPFMGPSLEENREKITGNIRKALVEAIR